MRMNLELSLVQQNAVDRDMLDSLTPWVDEQNAELMKLREEVEEILGLKEKFSRCNNLCERLARTQQ